ncbi:hypothetical protein KX729_09170 [Rhizobium sp. XQZ8]|uniref:phage adaptor protein n=1 Tax=Rhizobium populisoli TaxID=2859785 RepID=UPI001CA5612D|nr:hypothetical protein [Rhizobium populisoli]MBW6421609.1 hypothetical protein [Rhizobium populisoli]
MALANYNDLQSTIADYALGITSADPISTFIALGEGDVFTRVKHYLAETTITTSSTANAITLPADFSEARSITVDGIKAKPVSIYGAKLYAGEIGYLQSGNTYVFVPTQETPRVVELTYYAKPLALSESNPSNWLLTTFPAVYLHASLVRAYRWRRDADSEAAEKASLEEALALLDADHRKAVHSGNPIIMNDGGLFYAN